MARRPERERVCDSQGIHKFTPGASNGKTLSADFAASDRREEKYRPVDQYDPAKVCCIQLN
jgi:hypothetical protein